MKKNLFSEQVGIVTGGSSGRVGFAAGVGFAARLAGR